MSKKITNEDIEKANVRLKPVFGIRPGVYLTGIYGVVLLLILFLVLFLPGIRNYGAKIVVETIPPNAPVFVDDIYMGTTPCDFFVEKGEREFKIEKSYFETITFKKGVKGRVFGSRFFPRKINITEDLKLADQKGFFENRFKQASSYGLIEDFYDRFQIPPIISKTVDDFLNSGEPAETDLLYDFLYSMRVNMGSPDILNDYVKAVDFAAHPEKTNETIEIGEDSVDISLIFDYFSNKNNIQGLALSILRAYPFDERLQILKTLSAVEGVPANPVDLLYSLPDKGTFSAPELEKDIINFSGQDFIHISGGSYLTGNSVAASPDSILSDNFLASFPHVETVEAFYISSKEITRQDYNMFLNENPEWKKDNLSALVEQQLVSEDYLRFQDFANPSVPVAGISWYAAKAYCSWLGTKLPANIAGSFEIRLPTEAEWEAAAVLNEQKSMSTVFHTSGAASAKPADITRAGAAGLHDLMGNLWEWCDNWYFPADSLNGSYGLAGSSFAGVEKAVRGGSWANRETDISISTRGSQDPTWSTPFLGFRPVLVKK